MVDRAGAAGLVLSEGIWGQGFFVATSPPLFAAYLSDAAPAACFDYPRRISNRQSKEDFSMFYLLTSGRGGGIKFSADPEKISTPFVSPTAQYPSLG